METFKIQDPAAYRDQYHFDETNKDCKWFVTISPDYKVQALFSYLPNIYDLMTRNEKIVMLDIVDKTVTPQLEDITVKNHALVFEHNIGINNYG